MIAPSKKMARFSPGQLVKHKRYHYRALVVSHDDFCAADEKWYQANNTQPNRCQPWYHCLVHGCEAVTYAAEENLVPDNSGEPIQHPLLEKFFGEFKDGSYTRNQHPWQD